MSKKIIAESLRVAALSQRESQILELAAQGYIDNQISIQLGVSNSTVATYWDRIRAKLGANNRAHAIALGMPRNRLDHADEELSNFIVRRIQDEAIFVCDRTGSILSWNEGVHNLFGYEEKEWIGQHSSIFFIPEEKEDVNIEFEDAEKAGVSVNDRWHLRKDGSRFWGTNTVIPLVEVNHAGYAKIVRMKPEP